MTYLPPTAPSRLSLAEFAYEKSAYPEKGTTSVQTKSRRKAGWLGGAALAALLVAVAAPAARATTVTTDPLHGVCNGSGSCTDNGTNTPLGGSTQFGFTASSAAKGGTTGTLTLDILLPNVYAQPASFSITGIGTNPSGTATEVSKTAWTSGDLDTYLGLSASPANPIGAYLPTTLTFASAAGATGYYVYQVSFTATLFPPSNTTDEWNAISGLNNDLGSYIVGFFSTGSSGPCQTTGKNGAWCATANSGALLDNTPSGTTRSVPEPGSLALLGTALVGMFLVGKKLNRRKTT